MKTFVAAFLALTASASVVRADMPVLALQGAETLDPYRALVDKAQGHIDAGEVIEAELPGLRTWVAAQSKRIASEEAFRASVALPMCQAVWGIESSRAIIAQEKANPSGVVNLEILHDAGMAMQYHTATISALRPRYAAFRRHAFTGWKSEGVCVAAARQ